MNPKISCLTATYGRFSVLSEAVTCFVNQDYENKELIILNNHPEPLHSSLPQVRIYNEPIHRTLGHCRNRLIELATGDYVRTWDDDDLYLGWTLSQGAEHVGNLNVWKPARSWFSRKGRPFELAKNVFEAAMLVKLDFAKRWKYKESGGDEHAPLFTGLEKEGGYGEKDMGVLASYVYRWGWGMHHISGSLGSGSIEQRTANWMNANKDVPNGRALQLVSVNQHWRALMNDVKATMNHQEFELLRSKFAESHEA